MCKYSFLDKIYQIKYDPENIISYVGNQKSIISFDFTANVWKIRDESNPYFSAISEAPFRTLAIGNFEWTIHNDTKCNQDSYSTVLSLTSCSTKQFTCGNGLCINIDERLLQFKIKTKYVLKLKVFFKTQHIVNTIPLF